MVKLIDQSIKNDVYKSYIIKGMAAREVVSLYGISNYSLYKIIQQVEDSLGLERMVVNRTRLFRMRPQKIVINKIGDKNTSKVFKDDIKITKLEDGIIITKASSEDDDEIVDISSLDIYRKLEGKMSNYQ